MGQGHRINNAILLYVVSCSTMPITLNMHYSAWALHNPNINWLCDAVTLERKLKTKILSISSKE